MAEDLDVMKVKDLLPEESDWDDDKISMYLDSGESVYEVLRSYWTSKAAKLSEMIDVSESGSSRSMSRLYDNALRLAEYWDALVNKQTDREKEDEKDRPTTINKIVRT